MHLQGEFIGANAPKAEPALQSCDRTEKFRFNNGYPGMKCFQGADVYFYYDTPTLRITVYMHAPGRWMERNKGVMEGIAGSVWVGQPM